MLIAILNSVARAAPGTLGALLLALSAGADAARGAEPPKSTPPIPLAERPYGIRFWISFADPQSHSASVRTGVAREFHNLVAQHVGSVWESTFEEPPAGFTPESLPPPAEMKQRAGAGDKVMWIRISSGGDRSQSALAMREYDAVHESWGPLLIEPIGDIERLPLRLLDLAVQLFRVRAALAGTDPDGGIRLSIQGLALQPAQAQFALVAPGTTFRLYREFLKDDEVVAREPIQWTYALYEKTNDDGALGSCRIISAVRLPLAARRRGRSRIVALATCVVPTSASTIRFLAGDAKETQPAAGFEVFIRQHGNPAFALIGATNADGEVVLPANHPLASPVGKSTALIHVLLNEGKVNLADVPVVPGEPELITARVRIDPLVAEVEARTASLQEDIVDTVARRAILLKQLNHWVSKNDAAKAKSVEAEFNRLPGKEHFQDRLKEMQEEIEAKRALSGAPRLSRVVVSMFEQTDVLLEKYFRTASVTVEETTTKQ